MTRAEAERFLAMTEPDRMKFMRSLSPYERERILVIVALAMRAEKLNAA